MPKCFEKPCKNVIFVHKFSLIGLLLQKSIYQFTCNLHNATHLENNRSYDLNGKCNLFCNLKYFRFSVK